MMCVGSLWFMCSLCKRFLVSVCSMTWFFVWYMFGVYFMCDMWCMCVFAIYFACYKYSVCCMFLSVCLVWNVSAVRVYLDFLISSTALNSKLVHVHPFQDFDQNSYSGLSYFSDTVQFTSQTYLIIVFTFLLFLLLLLII